MDKLCYQLMTNALPQIILQPFIIAYYTYKTYQRWVGLGDAIVTSFSISQYLHTSVCVTHTSTSPLHMDPHLHTLTATPSPITLMISMLQLDSMGYIGPLSIYAFFVVSTILNKFIMGPVVSRVFQQERQEGDFRYVLLGAVCP